MEINEGYWLRMDIDNIEKDFIKDVEMVKNSVKKAVPENKCGGAYEFGFDALQIVCNEVIKRLEDLKEKV